jgi:hypothetical protein
VKPSLDAGSHIKSRFLVQEDLSIIKAALQVNAYLINDKISFAQNSAWDVQQTIMEVVDLHNEAC